mmetsp:Transcript_21658/g.73629  ORF Transcript_21658/g.73629 Transcript_21658/m.73629 type:complete len:227 (-) Transcript_21658:1115-1795(-)
MASKSSVQSWPAHIVMESAPPGWDFRYALVSYTLPFTTIQQSSGVPCLASSTAVTTLPDFFFSSGGGLGAAGGLYGFLPATRADSPWPSAIELRAVTVSHPPATLPIHPPSDGPATVGCSKASSVAPHILRLWTRTRKRQLLPMPITFHVKLSGCVLLPSSHALQPISPAFLSSLYVSSMFQKIQHQYLCPGRIFSKRSMLHRRHVRPLSSVTSTRVTLRPPPLYA